ncbi:MAG: PH domain-containing protein [Actinomycetota bacterium]|nr:PH domain-containing protein [Geodermatophilaceae bacterium]MDQ3053975.1 PH domain-containing protein [Actinomycetota bacterium]
MSRTLVRLQMNRISLVPAVVAVVCALPLATASPWLLFLLLLPAAWISYVMRSGVDVDDDGLTVRALFGSIRLPWARVSGVLIGKRHELSVATVGGGAVRLPNLRVRDLPRLYEATGGRLGLPGDDDA